MPGHSAPSLHSQSSSTQTVVRSPSGTFPDLLPSTLFKLLGKSIEAEDACAAFSLLQVLLNRLITTTSCLQALPKYIRDLEDFQALSVQAVYAGRLFQSAVDKERLSEKPAWNTLVVLMKVVDEAFKKVHSFTRQSIVNKPLPAIPVDDDALSGTTLVDGSIFDKRISTWTVSTGTEDLFEEARGITDFPSQPIGSRPPHLLKLMSTQDSVMSKRKLLRALGLQKKKKKVDPRRHGMIFEAGFCVAGLDEVSSIGSVNLPYVLREAALYTFNEFGFPSHLGPETDSLPGQRSELVFKKQAENKDQNEEQIKTVFPLLHAPIDGLIDAVTSLEARTNPHLIDFFLLTFRLYIAPTDLVKALRRHCRAEIPADLSEKDTHQLVFCGLAKRLRIANLIRVWLDQYWRPQHDGEALPYVEKLLRKDLMELVPDSLTGYILKGIENAKNNVDSRKKFRQEYYEELCSRVPSTKPPALESLDPNNLTLEHLMETPSGAIELARQLTLKAFDLLGKLDPEEFVFSRLVGSAYAQTLKNKDASYFDSLGKWVQASVFGVDASLSSPPGDYDRMAKTLNFWTLVAEECLNLNDFTSSSSISVGYSTIPMERLSLLSKAMSPECRDRGSKTKNVAHGTSTYQSRLSKAREQSLPFIPRFAAIDNLLSTNHAKDKPDPRETLVPVPNCCAAYHATSSLEAAYVPYNLSPAFSSIMRPWIDENLGQYAIFTTNRWDELLYKWSYELEPKAGNHGPGGNPTVVEFWGKPASKSESVETPQKQGKAAAMKSKLSLISSKLVHKA